MRQAIAQDSHGRAVEAAGEIAFALEQKQYAGLLVDQQQAGKLPLRVTHNDTKLNNVLFDRHTRKALCVIDLDTVMPGLVAYDFGDSIRFGASTAAEDEPDINRVSLSPAGSAGRHSPAAGGRVPLAAGGIVASRKAVPTGNWL